MAPFRIYQMKVEMLDVGPILSMAYFGDLSIRVALDFPYRGWGNALDHEKETTKIPILG